MTGSSAELLLHPVRLRIVQAFLGEQQRTTGELRAELPDVSAATLYRQVAALVEGGVLVVTAERRARGAVERTYRLRAERATVQPSELAALTVEEHRAGFLTFVAGLLADFDRYLATPGADLERDLVGYRQTGFYASDAELEAVIAALRAAVAPQADVGPGPGRTRRLLTTMLLPAPHPPAGASD